MKALINFSKDDESIMVLGWYWYLGWHYTIPKSLTMKQFSFYEKKKHVRKEFYINIYDYKIS